MTLTDCFKTGSCPPLFHSWAAINKLQWDRPFPATARKRTDTPVSPWLGFGHRLASRQKVFQLLRVPPPGLIPFHIFLVHELSVTRDQAPIACLIVLSPPLPRRRAPIPLAALHGLQEHQQERKGLTQATHCARSLLPLSEKVLRVLSSLSPTPRMGRPPLRHHR